MSEIDPQAWLLARRAQARICRRANPHLGYCGRCGMPWSDAAGHATPYGDGGCFPLCEECWAQLTPEERLPYYHALWLDWQAQSDETLPNETWEEIKAAVLAGK